MDGVDWSDDLYNLTNTTDHLIVDAAVLTSIGVLTFLSCAISFYLIYQHVNNYTRPPQQRYIVRIVIMVPIYAVLSYISLFIYEYQTYLAIFRDCYEAYALYQFFALCIEYANGWKNMEAAFATKPERKCLEPFCCIKTKPDGDLLRWCQRGILQYTLIRPITTIASAILLAVGYYDEGEWRADRGWLWIFIVNNVCVSVSLYFIVLFYQVSKTALKPYNPLLKFSVIKGIVFFCYWQSILLILIAWIPGIHFRDWNHEKIAVMLQNILICGEMFFFGLLQWFAFPYAVYEIKALSQAPLARPYQLGGDIKGSIADTLNQQDMRKDTVEAFVPEKLRKLKIKKDDPDVDLSDSDSDIVPLDSDDDRPISPRSRGEKRTDRDAPLDTDEPFTGHLKDDIGGKSDITRR